MRAEVGVGLVRGVEVSVGMEVGIGGAVVSVALFDVCSGVELSMEVGVGAAVRAGSGVASLNH